ncbi:MAG: serine/threonine-protein kinase [Anaerolineae bacterium]
MANDKCFDVEQARAVISDPRYIIDEFIGSGAMACVYKARERGTPNVYALKILREQYRQRKQFLAIFEREAQHMRDLQYPNIVRFYKFVREADSAYIIMDYVQGTAITHLIQDVKSSDIPIPLPKIVRIMAQIARAINYLHSEGFIHRDIKPGNVLLVGEDESAFLTDLGIAGSSDDPSLSGAGTPSYMPHEQQIKESIDHTADIYAFAIMLYEMFTGEKPFIPPTGLTFSEARRAVIEMHEKQPPPSLSQKRDDLPPEIDAIFAKALAKNPTERYQSVLDFAEDVHEVLLPQLPDDLRNFDRIQPQAIERPVQTEIVEVPANPNQVLRWVSIALIVIALLTGVGLWFNSQFNSPIILTDTPTSPTSDTPTVTASVTATSTPTVTVTHTPTATVTHTPTATVTHTPTTEPSVTASPTITPTASDTPQPTAFLADAEAVTLARGANTIGYSTDLNMSMQYVASVRMGRVPLRLPDDRDGFQIMLSIERDSIRDNARFGIIFYSQDEANYLLLLVDAVDNSATLSAVQDGVSSPIERVRFQVVPTSITLTVRDRFIRAEMGAISLQGQFTEWQGGMVALQVPAGEDALRLTDLTISLLDVDTVPAGTLPRVDPLGLLREDVRALSASGNENALVDCTRFNRIYERLDAHALIDGAQEIIAQVQSVSSVIVSRCQTERDNQSVEFGFSDYLNWESGINTVLMRFEQEQ